ncbi:diacylglycerol/lipid kinase family protein [Alteribacillus sp. HJP-4]|uniref:diacylglycerol/lipid kinase family protein n=1 Tax=Alteribacillus sp. HJP-4 TaxID=2775394 RepID=UPI0035CD100B
MYEKGLLLYNGNQEQAVNQKVLDAVIGTIAVHVKELSLKQTEYKGHAGEICRGFTEDVDILFILGGDGTVHECFNGLAALENPPVAAILPGGTCNDFSRELAIPQNLRRSAETLMSGEVRNVDIGKMNNDYFVNFLGVGMIAETSENINEELKGVFGKVSYFISAIQTIGTTEPFSFTLQADGESFQRKGVMILVANGRFIGTNRLPVDNISIEDGKFDIFIVNQGGAPLVKEFFGTKTPFTWDPNQSEIDHLRASEITIETEQPMKIDADGETYLETPVNISLVKKKIPVLAGENKALLGFNQK